MGTTGAGLGSHSHGHLASPQYLEHQQGAVSVNREGVSRIPATFLSCVLSKLSSSLPRPLRGQHSYPCAHASVNQPGWAQRLLPNGRKDIMKKSYAPLNPWTPLLPVTQPCHQSRVAAATGGLDEHPRSKHSSRLTSSTAVNRVVPPAPLKRRDSKHGQEP